MSIINIIFNTRSDDPAKIGSIEMDVTIEEQHERSAFITENSIEDGSTIGDHIILDPERVTIDGFITSAPVSFFGPRLGLGFGRVISGYKQLDELWKKKEPFTLVTGYGSYKNMVIERLSMPRTKEVGLMFRAEMKKITIIKTGLGAIGSSAPGVADRAAGLTDGGRQVPREASPATAARGSLLSDILGFLGI